MSKKEPGKRKGPRRSQVASIYDWRTESLFPEQRKKARTPVSAQRYEAGKSGVARKTKSNPDRYEPGIKKLAGDLPF